MAGRNDNRSISLADVVSIEAWYQRFTEDRRDSGFFLHIKFQDGVFGSQPENPLRFKIRLKHATASIVLEEPLTAPRHDVRRDRIEVEAKRISEQKSGYAGSAGAQAEIGVSSLGVSGKATARASGQVDTQGSTALTVTQISHSGMTIEHSADPDGNNCWSFAPVVGPHLIGQAFNTTTPLMKLVHEAELSRVPPVVKVQVNCLREHIDVVDLEVKEEKKDLLRRGMGEAQKLRLVEEMIKTALSENGLLFEGELDKVSRVQVADVIAMEE